MTDLSTKKVIFVIASNGFQPIEYNVPKEMLKKEGITVVTASDKPGGAVASDESTTPVDITLDDVNLSEYDGIFFIGGPGAMDCLDTPISYSLISQAKQLEIPYGAICIAPRILAKAYGLQNKRATGWNGDNALEALFKGYDCTYDDEPICTDGLVVTARDPEAAVKFGEGILRVLTKKALR